MITARDVEQNDLQYGKDFVYLGNVRYRAGDNKAVQ